MSEIMRRVIKTSAFGDIAVLECMHRIVIDIVPELVNKNDKIPCPTCAEIKAAREEVLEMCIDALEYGVECHDSLVYAIRQAFKERFHE